MALVNLVDPEQAAAALTAWLADRLGDGVAPTVSDARIPKESGLSAETLLFTASWDDAEGPHRQRLVARVTPSGPALYKDYDLAREFRVMRAVTRQGTIPLPRVLWSEEDPAVLGAPFLVMEHVDGHAPLDDPPFTAEGFVVELPPERQSVLYDNGLAAMAAVHALDTGALALDDVFPRGDPIATGLAYWREFFAWATAGAANPLIEAGLAWLESHRPAAPRHPTLCWGDARLGNLLLDDDQAVTAVLDWEMATLSAPEFDLGWWLFAMRHHSDGMGIPQPPGFPGHDEAVARFEQASGGRPVQDLRFWEVFAGVRFCSIVARGATLMIAGGAIPKDSQMAINNPGTRILAELLELPAPTGDADYYVGNR